MTGKVKENARRLLSVFLAAVMTLQLASPALAAESSPPQYELESARLEKKDLADGNLVYFGTATAVVEEKKADYSFRIYREGDLSEEVSVLLKTVDMTAVYGKDYELLEDGVKVTGNGMSLLEQSIKGNAPDLEDKNIEIDMNDYTVSANSAAESADVREAEAGSSGKDASAEDTASSEEAAGPEAEAVISSSDADADADADTDAVSVSPAAEEGSELSERSGGVSADLSVQATTAAQAASISDSDVYIPLSARKEAQTGEPTRDLYKTENPEIAEQLSDELFRELSIKAAASLPPSSRLKVTFAPGEDEKVLRFRILDDDDSEGNEGFSLMLDDPEGVEIYSIGSLSVSIMDDEPTVKSVVSFTDDSFRSENGVAVIKLEREKADHSLCDFTLYTIENTAIAGENYKELYGTVAFSPYEMTKEIEIPVTGKGSFSVEITDFAGCEAGSITRAEVEINEKETQAAGLKKNGAGSPDELPLTGDGDSGLKSFEININNRPLTVEYTMPGEGSLPSEGTIMDYGYTPALETGKYYFSTDKNYGGYFNYGIREGTNPGYFGTYTSEYSANTDASDMNSGDNVGVLEYYSPWAWEEGGVYAQSEKLPALWFQYLVPDWASISSAYGNQQADFELPGSGLDRVMRFDQFDRDQNKPVITLLKDGKPLMEDQNLKLGAVDHSSFCTKSYVRLYGVAAMYQKFNVEIRQPAELTYKYGDMDTRSAAMQAYLKSGAEVLYSGSRDFYANPDPDKTNLVFNLSSTNLNGHTGIFGKINGFILRLTANRDNEVILNYPEDFRAFLESKRGTLVNEALDYSDSNIQSELDKIAANPGSIPYDAFFINWINEKETGVVSSEQGYYHTIVATPVVEYEDISVEVMAPSQGADQGYFTSVSLNTLGEKTFHAGDTLDLSAAVSDPAAFHVRGYEVSTVADGVTFNSITDTTTLFLESGKKYKIRPLIAKNDNKIEILFENGAEEFLSVRGTISADELENDPVLKGRCILNAEPSGKTLTEKISPVKGKIYTLAFTCREEDGYIYRPVITHGNNTYRTNFYYMRGAEDVRDNYIRVGYERVEKDSLNSYEIKGTVSSASAPVRKSGIAVTNLPAVNYYVTAGSNTQLTNNKNELIPNTVSAATDDRGMFTMVGVSGNEGDLITLLITNGVTNGDILRLKLTGTSTVNAGNQYIDYPYGAPKVVDESITYKYDKDANNSKSDNRDNQICIYDDNLKLEMFVETYGKNVDEAVFTAYTVTGKKTEFKADKTLSTNGIVKFECVIPNMTQNLHAGDRLSVHLVDNTSTSMEVGGVKQQIEVTYPDVDTGLSFYTQNALTPPQFFASEITGATNVPLLGSSSAKGETGFITFNKINWEGGTGYTVYVSADVMLWNDLKPLTASEKLETLRSLQSAGAQAAKKDDSSKAGNEAPKEIQENQLDGENDKNAGAAKMKTGESSDNRTSLNVSIVMVFDFVLKENVGYIFACGTVAAGGQFTFYRTFPKIIAGVPCFLNLLSHAQVNLIIGYVTKKGAAALTAEEFQSHAGNISNPLGENDAYLSFCHTGKIQVGVGACDFISARGYGMLTIQFLSSFIPNSEGGSLFSIAAGIGLDLLILSIEIDIARFTRGTGLLKTDTTFTFFNDFTGINFDENKTVSKNSVKKGSGVLLDESSGDRILEVGRTQVVRAHEYDPGTADMSSFGKGIARSEEIAALCSDGSESTAFTPLLENAAEHTRPCILNLGDGKRMVAFIGNKDGMEMLYYSVYDGENWSTPELVADDATPDYSPVMELMPDGSVLIVWNDANSSFTVSDTSIDKLNKLGISFASYDPEKGEMSEKINLVDNEYCNLLPEVSVDGDCVYVIYMIRDLHKVKEEQDLLDFTDNYSTMACVKYDFSKTPEENEKEAFEKYIPIFHEKLKDPLVMDYHADVVSISDNSLMIAAYTVDTDTDLETVSDRELYLGLTDLKGELKEDVDLYPIKVETIAGSPSAPDLTKINGKLYFTWLENGNTFNMVELYDILESIFDPMGYISRIEDDELREALTQLAEAYLKNWEENASEDMDWYKKTAEDLGISGDYYEDSVYERLASGNMLPASGSFTPAGEETSPGTYILTSDGNDLYVIYTQGGRELNDTGRQIFGARYENGHSDANDVSAVSMNGFSKAVQLTNYDDMVVDEMDLYMDDTGDIYCISNFYKQYIEDIDGQARLATGPNTIAGFKIVPEAELEVKDNSSLPYSLIPGTVENLKFSVRNTGLLPASGYKITLTEVSGGKDRVFYEETVNERLDSNNTKDFAVPWDIPEDLSNTSIKVKVTLNGKESEQSVEVPYESKIALENAEISFSEEEQKAIASVTVRNVGNRVSEQKTLSLVSLNEAGEAGKTFAAEQIGALKPGASVEVSVPVEPEDEDYNYLDYIDLMFTTGEEDEEAHLRLVKTLLKTTSPWGDGTKPEVTISYNSTGAFQISANSTVKDVENHILKGVTVVENPSLSSDVAVSWNDVITDEELLSRFGATGGTLGFDLVLESNNAVADPLKGLSVELSKAADGKFSFKEAEVGTAVISMNKAEEIQFEKSRIPVDDIIEGGTKGIGLYIEGVGGVESGKFEIQKVTASNKPSRTGDGFLQIKIRPAKDATKDEKKLIKAAAKEIKKAAKTNDIFRYTVVARDLSTLTDSRAITNGVYKAKKQTFTGQWLNSSNKKVKISVKDVKAVKNESGELTLTGSGGSYTGTITLAKDAYTEK